MTNPTVCILTSGTGSRLGFYTKKKNKSLLSLNKKSIISKIFENFPKNSEFIVSIGYKGKQVRDNIHSFDLVNCFWEFFKKPRKGEIYNIGGGRFSNCSILEALMIIEDICKIKIKKDYLSKNRIGDHIWYISNMKKFKTHYPKWKQNYTTRKIIKELIDYTLL